MRLVGGVVFGLLAMLATACADDARQSSASAPASDAVPVPTEGGVVEFPANGEVADVLALDNNFIVQTLTVTAGTEVRWVNNGRNGHNVLPEGDPEATAFGIQIDDFQPGDSYSHVFTTPGTYVYYCSVHGTATAGMFGTIIVTTP